MDAAANAFIKKATKRQKKKTEVAEVDIEDTFCKYAKTLGCWSVKLVFLSGRGFPDRTILCPGGRILFIEFKRKGKTPGPIQERIRERLCKLGFLYIVADRIGTAETALDKFLQN